MGTASWPVSLPLNLVKVAIRTRVIHVGVVIPASHLVRGHLVTIIPNRPERATDLSATDLEWRKRHIVSRTLRLTTNPPLHPFRARRLMRTPFPGLKPVETLG